MNRPVQRSDVRRRRSRASRRRAAGRLEFHRPREPAARPPLSEAHFREPARSPASPALTGLGCSHRRTAQGHAVRVHGTARNELPLSSLMTTLAPAGSCWSCHSTVVLGRDIIDPTNGAGPGHGLRHYLRPREWPLSRPLRCHSARCFGSPCGLRQPWARRGARATLAPRRCHSRGGRRSAGGTANTPRPCRSPLRTAA